MLIHNLIGAIGDEMGIADFIGMGVLRLARFQIEGGDAMPIARLITFSQFIAFAFDGTHMHDDASGGVFSTF